MPMLGATLPPDARPYKRTATFTEATIPKGLTADHATKAGVWGVINVLEGRLRYVAPSAGLDVVLDPSTRAVITPEELHRVAPLGRVSFYVEFWKPDQEPGRIGTPATGAEPALTYRVKPTGFSDWASLHALLVDCFAYMAPRIEPPSSLGAMTPDSLRQKSEAETLVLVEAGERLIACGFLKEAADAIYLGKLAVTPDYRGRGILREIVSLAADLARQHAKSWLELETRIELTENHRAFASLGFVKTAETSHPGYDRPTSIIMRKAV